MAETIIIRGEGITLDLILWRCHGVRGQALVERALALNPGLAALGPVLPLGAAVVIPDLPPASVTPPVRVVSLFG
ncbi:MAG: tail protein X [Pararhodobacter sp.]|nr:tail protein X [Pararhodobacter sp.]